MAVLHPADALPLPVAAGGAARSPVVNCVAYAANGRRMYDTTLDQISDVLAEPEAFIWLGLHEPDDPMLLKIQEEFGLHELAIEDAQHAHQRPKIEVYDDTLFIVVHTSQFVEGKVRFGETHIFLGKRFLITIRHGASLSYARARASCEQTPEMLALGPSFGLYSVLDFIVDNYFPIVSSFETELRELETRIFNERFDRDTIERLYQLKRETVTLRLAVTPMHDILNQLKRFFPGLIHEEVRVYFRDVFDHAVRMSEATSTLGEMISAALQVNLAMVSVGQNEVTKRLAGWAAILAIPTTVGAIYGMNFEHMPELKWEYGYFYVIGLTLSLCLGLYWRLKKADWL
ncbi:MAG: magnesium/cobalt transporter CorA [Xanthomonadales bacterium]|nr:Cobalt/magnesium transport protein CorA [Xanthomonadales bacterium]MCC6591644.1 magnesium/cobalt transporter CorA [Xanthomonadales bacterium]MCE7932679.1 magnesium and cobalt transport protein CorA [Xanthomonadales bacterium PRO6]